MPLLGERPARRPGEGSPHRSGSSLDDLEHALTPALSPREWETRMTHAGLSGRIRLTCRQGVWALGASELC